MICYVLQVENGIEPILFGPFTNESDRDDKARELAGGRVGESSDGDGIFWLEVHEDRRPVVGSYSGGFLEGE